MSPKERLDAQRRAQLAADRALLSDLTSEYAKTFKSVRRELARLTKQIAEARARGEIVNPAWLFQRARLDRFERELGAELVMYLDLAKRKIEAASVQALIDGQMDARTLLAQTLPPGISPMPALPLEQLKGFVTQSATGSPLGNLLAGLGTQAAQEARSVLVEGVALGLGTREIGRNLTTAFAGNANRALLVARTEVIRAYRDAALRTYRQNHTVVKGWVWIAQLGSRTCPVCIAKHGSFHSLEEDFGSHPACRCSPAPASRDWAELGIDAPETKIDPEKGEAWFARQPADVQRSILGPGKYRLYADGEIKLDDLVQETVHPVWGKGLRERPLKALVATATPKLPQGAVPRFASVDEAVAWGRANLAEEVLVRPNANLAGVQSAMEGAHAGLGGTRVNRLNLAWDGKRDEISKGAGPAVIARARFRGRGAEQYRDIQVRASHIAKPEKMQVVADEVHGIWQKQRLANAADAAERLERLKTSDSPSVPYLREDNERRLARAEETVRFASYEDADDPLFAVVAHEAGHARDYALGGRGRAFGITSKGAWRVSEYAASSSTELYAEVISMIAQGRRSEIPIEILEAFEAL